MREFHKDLFWLYGVIVGLAIREALTQALHHTFSIPPSEGQWALHIEVWRTILFMLMIIRFYVGSVVFFNKVHGPTSPASGSNYYLDFVMGLTQFLLFYAWSVTIFAYSRSSKGFSYYLFVMFLILLFDLVWLGCNAPYDTAETLKIWAIINTLTALISFLVFVTSADMFDLNFQVAEEIALVPVGLISLLDITENVSDTPIFVKLLHSVLPRQIKPTAVPAASPAASSDTPSEVGG